MLIDFFFTLRAAKLKVSVKEYLTLLEAIKAGVIDDDELVLARAALDLGFDPARFADRPKLAIKLIAVALLSNTSARAAASPCEPLPGPRNSARRSVAWRPASWSWSCSCCRRCCAGTTPAPWPSSVRRS